MAVSLPNGALVAMATGLATSVPFTAISNAAGSPGAGAVLTVATGHGVIANDIIVLTSGWSRLNSKAVRVGAVTSTTITLDNIDTSNTTTFPPGGGVGSLQDVSGWQQILQVLGSATSGGTQQFVTYQFLEGDSQLRIPTFKDAFGLDFTIADDPTLAGYILAAKANDDRLPRAVRITLPSGSILLYNAFVSVNKTPTLTVNAINAVTITLALLAEPVRY